MGGREQAEREEEEGGGDSEREAGGAGLLISSLAPSRAESVAEEKEAVSLAVIAADILFVK